MGRRIDTRRPRELTDEQKAMIEQHPELQQAIQKREQAERRASRTQGFQALEKLKKHERNVINTKNRLLYRLRQQIREEFDLTQAVIDIERQLRGKSAMRRRGRC
jgi:quinolinate synthase